MSLRKTMNEKTNMSVANLDSISFLTFGFSVFSFSVGENPKGKKEIQESREMS